MKEQEGSVYLARTDCSGQILAVFYTIVQVFMVLLCPCTGTHSPYPVETSSVTEVAVKSRSNLITQTCLCNILQYFTAVKLVIFS